MSSYTDNAHIAEVASCGGGAGKILIDYVKTFAKGVGKKTLDLNTADKFLHTYYEGLGFKMVNPKADQGDMFLDL
jgi:hypothetical protein